MSDPLTEAQTARAELRKSSYWPSAFKQKGANHLWLTDVHLAACIAGLTIPPPPPPPVTGGWDAAIAYTATRPAFTALREVPVSSQAQLSAAFANLRPGDHVFAAAPFTCSGEFAITAAPSAAAVIDLTGVTFSYTGTSNLPSVWIDGAANLRIFGGDIHGPLKGQVGNGGVLVYHATNVLWWGFNIHDVTSTGLGMVPVGGPIDHCDFYGTITRWGQNPSWDPHAEKGTGEHACNLVDGGTNVFTNNRIALDVSDGATGAGIEMGCSGAGTITGNTVLLRANGLHMVSTSQRSGNGFNLWGAVPMQVDLPYVEIANAQGYAVSVDTEYHADFSGLVFDFARSARTRLNPAWQGEPTFNPGPTYKDASGS